MTEAQSREKGIREKGETVNLRWWSFELKIRNFEHWISPPYFLDFQTNHKLCQIMNNLAKFDLGANVWMKK